MNPRARVTLVTLSALVASIGAGVTALRMLFLANADQAVPAFLAPLIVAFLIMNVALLAWAATLRGKLPPLSR